MEQLKKPFSLFLLLWSGQLLSRIGSGISAFALGIYLLQQSGSTSAYSFLLLCAFLPSVALAPVGGVLADKKDRKLMMIVGDLGSALGIGFIIAMLLFVPNQKWPVYLGVALSSLCVALHSPAFKASVTDLLDEEAYSKAGGLLQLAEASRYLVSPAIAGLLLSRFSLPFVLVIDLITFILGALTVCCIRTMVMQQHDESAQESIWRDFSAGAGYILREKIIFRLLCLTSVVTFLTGILQTLFVPIILSLTDVAGSGIVQSIAASGMLISSLLIGMMSKTHAQKKALAYSLVAAGLFYTLIGTSTNTIQITVTAFCFFFTLPFVNTGLEVLFRQNIANKMQGRVWSLISFVTQAGMLIAFGVAGALADHVFNPLLTDDGRFAGTLGSIIGTGSTRGSGLMLIICGLFLVLFAFFIAKNERNSSRLNIVITDTA